MSRSLDRDIPLQSVTRHLLDVFDRGLSELTIDHLQIPRVVKVGRKRVVAEPEYLGRREVLRG